MVFEWDPRKAWSNVSRHGVRFDEAETVFADVLSLTNADPLHSGDESPFVTFGMSTKQRLLVVVHTARDGRIRIISARVATSREKKAYEQNP